jgi:hemoglobin
MPSVYEVVGGDGFFVELVDRFYDGVAQDPVLRPLYPDDLTDSRAHLAGFLIQYWGGPGTYSEQRGHPRLRLRHAPFAIGRVERDAWWTRMEAAVRSMDAVPEVEDDLLAYFDQAATAMINTGLSQFTA